MDFRNKISSTARARITMFWVSRFKNRQTNIKLTVSKQQDFAIFEKPIFLESYLIVIPSQVNIPKDYYLFREFVIGIYYVGINSP